MTCRCKNQPRSAAPTPAAARQPSARRATDCAGVRRGGSARTRASCASRATHLRPRATSLRSRPAASPSGRQRPRVPRANLLCSRPAASPCRGGSGHASYGLLDRSRRACPARSLPITSQPRPTARTGRGGSTCQAVNGVSDSSPRCKRRAPRGASRRVDVQVFACASSNDEPRRRATTTSSNRHHHRPGRAARWSARAAGRRVAAGRTWGSRRAARAATARRCPRCSPTSAGARRARRACRAAQRRPRARGPGWRGARRRAAVVASGEWW